MSKWIGRGLAAALCLAVPTGPAWAAIISTEVFAGMKIEREGVVEAIGTDQGATAAFVELTGPQSGRTAYADLQLTQPTGERALLEFELGYDGTPDLESTGYMGQSSNGSNRYEINYHAVTNSLLSYGWSFDYLGPNPFGLQVVRILSNGGQLELLGNEGLPGHHEGSGSLPLLAGNDYLIEVRFVPNVFGNIGNFRGDLVGTMEFDFGGEGEVIPEPASLGLLGSGLLALAARRRLRG